MRNKFWTASEVEFLENMYPNNLNKYIGEKLGRNENQVSCKAKLMGLKKSESYTQKLKAEQGKKLVEVSIPYRFYKGQEFPEGSKDNRFKNGHVPKSKGQKVSPEKYEIMSKTFFKKGSKVREVYKTGDIIVRNSGGGFKYQYIKDESGDFVLLHRYKWEKVHGKIKRGYAIIFIDGNRMNADISNLQCVSSIELMEKNSITRYPQDLRSLIVLQSKVNKKIKEIENGK